jgi:hypothetical protein
VTSSRSTRLPTWSRQHGTAAAYLTTLGREELAARLPELREPLVVHGHTTVFVADR